MAKAIGLPRENVEVGITGFEVSLTYVFQTSITVEQAKTAVAATAGVSVDTVKITISRRLSTSRRLTSIVEAIITTTDAATAKSVKSLAVKTDTLKAELSKAGVSAEPAVKVAPVVTVKTDTRVISSPGSSLQVPNSTKLAEVAAAVGGTVTVTHVKSGATTTAGTITTTTMTITPSATPSASSVADTLSPNDASDTPLGLIIVVVGFSVVFAAMGVGFALRIARCNWRKLRKQARSTEGNEDTKLESPVTAASTVLVDTIDSSKWEEPSNAAVESEPKVPSSSREADIASCEPVSSVAPAILAFIDENPEAGLTTLLSEEVRIKGNTSSPEASPRLQQSRGERESCLCVGIC